MSMRNHIEAKLQAAFDPPVLEVLDESANHSRGQETHFKVTLVTPRFAGQRLIARHRQVNDLLAEELRRVHALAMHTYTPEEWSARTGAPASPDCAHGH
jgi:BolA protein